MNRNLGICFIILILVFVGDGFSDDRVKVLARVEVRETAGLAREREYLEFPLQVQLADSMSEQIALTAIDEQTGEKIYCQSWIEKTLAAKGLAMVRVIFPISIEAGTEKTFLLQQAEVAPLPGTDLRVQGEGLELIIENESYRADLTRRNQPEPKTHASGQLQELLIKMGFNQLLTNAEDRVHWAPNFKREEIEWYTTIAHWENPAEYWVEKGPYLVQTFRRDKAPQHPEILLTAVYKFYAGLPYFRFYSEMEFRRDLPLELLRNDEMTTDSMFTHLAFQRPDGEVASMRFQERYQLLQERPIEDDARWICFYNAERGFAFGSIRLRYDNRNRCGELSPTFRPHTQIGEWLDRKYWNRRLIHDHLTLVPADSRYVEENAYLVFKIEPGDPVKNIRSWAKQLQNPLRVNVYPAPEE
ncbi:MAG: hypothetical protein Kow0042_00420 [Calditrichia bacterium]